MKGVCYSIVFSIPNEIIFSIKLCNPLLRIFSILIDRIQFYSPVTWVIKIATSLLIPTNLSTVTSLPLYAVSNLSTHVCKIAICRCSQPMTGLKSKRSLDDEEVVKAIHKSNQYGTTTMIVDTRPKVSYIDSWLVK